MKTFDSFPVSKQENSESNERVDFLELVDLCREVEEKGALPTATEFSISESGFTEVMSEELSEDLIAETLKDLDIVTAKYNDFRYKLSASFDTNAESWNSEPIGKILKNFAVELHEFRGRVERHDVFDQAYLINMYNAIASLMELSVSDEYATLKTQQKLEKLNAGAEKYQVEKDFFALFTALKRQTQTVLYLHDELTRNPNDEGKKQLVKEFFNPEHVAILKSKLSKLLQIKETNSSSGGSSL